MTPQPPDQGNALPDVELVLEPAEPGGEPHLLHPGWEDPDFDAFLRERGASSWVFLPFGPEPEKARKKKRYEKRIASLREKLGEHPLLEGGLRRRERLELLEPGIFVLDLGRAAARELAGLVKADAFYWGVPEAAVEVHPVQVRVFDDADGNFLEMARTGLADLRTTLQHVLRQPEDLSRQIGTDAGSLVLTVGALLAAGILSFALSWVFGAPARTDVHDPKADETIQAPQEPVAVDEGDEDSNHGSGLIGLLLHPVLLPSLLLARYLRRHYYKGSLKKPERELTADETLARWSEMRLHLLAVWAIAAVAVGLLTAAKLFRTRTLTIEELVDNTSTYLAICVWVLTPLAFSSGLDEAFSQLIEATFVVFFTILAMKFSLMIASWFSGILWSFLVGLTPFVLPLWIKSLVDTTLTLGAELFFLTYLLGYVWLKERTQFALRVSGEI